jgi:hypothetical protein
VFFPTPEDSFPLDFKRELFPILSAELGRQLEARKASEDDVLEDFNSWRKTRREAGRRR